MQGVELSLFYSSTSTTTLSKTLSLLSPIPIPIPKPPSLFSPIHLSLSLSLSKRSLPHHISRFSSTNQQQQQQPPEQNQNQSQDEEESDAEDIDVAALEEEARNAAREYSSSLSRHLTIGESFEFFSFPFNFCCIQSSHLVSEEEPNVPIQRGRKQSNRKISTVNVSNPFPIFKVIYFLC